LLLTKMFIIMIAFWFLKHFHLNLKRWIRNFYFLNLLI
jgi:hypothetical protein